MSSCTTMMDDFGKYDFVELIIFDIHTIPKGRLIAKQRLESVLKKGMGMYNALCSYGIREEPNVHDYFGSSRNYGNGLLFPIPGTLRDSLPCSTGGHRVGQVLCTQKNLDLSSEVTTPRYVAEKQLEALSDLGYSLKSSFELEFSIYHKDTLKPFGHEHRHSNMRVIANNQGLLLDFITELKAIGVNVDTLQSEAGKGQYEITLDVAECLEVADDINRFKNAASIFFDKNNMKASFMPKDSLKDFAHGFHFNHSLWTLPGEINLFLETNDPGKLSTLGRHWLAGLIAHAGALTALCCPTVNCYRRLHQPWTPTKPDWNMQMRYASFRLKVEGCDNVYLEDRIPSSACNPYLVTAGHIAAGLDGIKRKLSLDEANVSQDLPRSLESALKSLQEDEYMVQALGQQFVDIYVYTKTTYEINPMKALGECSEEKKLEMEKELYFDHC